MSTSDELRVLRDASDDPAFRALLDDVMAGRKSLREAASTDVFDQDAAARVTAGPDVLASMSEEELDALAEQGEQALTPPEPVRLRPMAPPRVDDEPDYEVEVMEQGSARPSTLMRPAQRDSRPGRRSRPRAPYRRPSPGRRRRVHHLRKDRTRTQGLLGQTCLPLAIEAHARHKSVATFLP